MTFADWRPIETFDTEGADAGREVMLFLPVYGGLVRVGTWSALASRWMDTHTILTPPTHWAPLPQPPPAQESEPVAAADITCGHDWELIYEARPSASQVITTWSCKDHPGIVKRTVIRTGRRPVTTYVLHGGRGSRSFTSLSQAAESWLKTKRRGRP